MHGRLEMLLLTIPVTEQLNNVYIIYIKLCGKQDGTVGHKKTFMPYMDIKTEKNTQKHCKTQKSYSMVFDMVPMQCTH